MFIHVVVSWVDFPISMATFNHHLHWLLVAKWLSSQLGPTSLANSCRSVEKTSVAFGGKNYSTSYGYTPWSKQMVFTSQKENDISSNNQSQPTWACIWNHMKYKQVLYSILTLKWNWQILKDADQHSSQEFYVQDAVPIGLPGAWPSTMFFTHGKKWVTLHWQIRCLRSCEFINWILLRGFVGIYSFSLFLEILAWNRWIFGPVISSGRGPSADCEAHWFQLFLCGIGQALENSQHTRDVTNVQQIMGGQWSKHPIIILQRHAWMKHRHNSQRLQYQPCFTGHWFIASVFKVRIRLKSSRKT